MKASLSHPLNSWTAPWGTLLEVGPMSLRASRGRNIKCPFFLPFLYYLEAHIPLSLSSTYQRGPRWPLVPICLGPVQFYHGNSCIRGTPWIQGKYRTVAPQGQTPTKGNKAQALISLHLGRTGMYYAPPSLVSYQVQWGLKFSFVSSWLESRGISTIWHVTEARQKRECLVYNSIYKVSELAKLTYGDKNPIHGFLGRQGVGSKGRLTGSWGNLQEWINALYLDSNICQNSPTADLKCVYLLYTDFTFQELILKIGVRASVTQKIQDRLEQ